MLEREMTVMSTEEPTTKKEEMNEEENITELPQSVETAKEEQTDKINKNDKNYPIHQGKIDCLDINECMEITLPIQQKYSNVISDVTYLEVISNKHRILGYFIKYTLKTYQFETHDICETTLNELSEIINTESNLLKCTESGILEIKSNYEEGEYNGKD